MSSHNPDIKCDVSIIFIKCKTDKLENYMLDVIKSWNT